MDAQEHETKADPNDRAEPSDDLDGYPNGWLKVQEIQDRRVGAFEYSDRSRNEREREAYHRDGGAEEDGDLHREQGAHRHAYDVDLKDAQESSYEVRDQRYPEPLFVLLVEVLDVPVDLSEFIDRLG